MQVLATLARLPGNPWVIPGAKPGAHLSSIFEPWRRVRARAGLDDVRLHDLRHSYASRALALGESLPVIAKLLGHAQIQTTARYTHLTRDAVRDAAIRVAHLIGEDIAPAGGPDHPHAAPERNGSPKPRPGRLPQGGVCGSGDRDNYMTVSTAIRASAARIAADIGADILPPRPRGDVRASSGAGVALAAGAP